MAYITDENGKYKRTVTCGHCYEAGHNKSSCPERKAKLAENIERWSKALKEDSFRDSWEKQNMQRRLDDAVMTQNKIQNLGKSRKCSYCHEPGHTRRTCQDRKNDIESEAHKMLHGRKILSPIMEEYGIGVGALLEYEGDIYTVERIEWEYITQDAIVGENGYSQCNTRPIQARSFPSEYYTRGQVRSFSLPTEVTNVNDVKVNSWSISKWKILSSAHRCHPSNFLNIDECRRVSKGLEMFNDGNDRPYQYLYPNG